MSALLVCLFARGLSADATTGTYTGSVSLRGNYYWERSTRVVAPALTAAMESPGGVRVDGTYLVDAITSASQATGVATDNVFREIRHDAQAGIGHEYDFGKSQLDLTLRGRFSREPDYHSRGLGFASALSLRERTTVLRLSGYFLHDDVYSKVRMAQGSGPLRAARAEPRGDLDTLSLGFAWDQVLSPLDTLTIGYDLALLAGFTANPYRMVVLEDQPQLYEKHPDFRVRNAVYTWFAHYVKQTRSALRFGYRLYEDSWSITAHAPEIRIYQELGPYLELRLRYRYYTQDYASFWRRGRNRSTHRHYTADPKMSPFQDQTFGLRLRLALGFLRDTPLRLFENAVLDISGEYMINTTRYGNGVIGQGGLIWPF